MLGELYGPGGVKRFLIYPQPVWAPDGSMYRMAGGWHLRHGQTGLTFAPLPSRAKAEEVWRRVRELRWPTVGEPSQETLVECEMAWLETWSRRARPVYWRWDA